MPTGIVGGTAGFGFGLALRAAKFGDDVWIGSRTKEKAEAAAKSVIERVPGAKVNGAENAEVAAMSTIVLVTVPFPGAADTYKAITPNIKEGVVVIDCIVPLASEVGGKPTRMLGVWEGSAAQQARGILGRKVPMASGFHTIMAAALEDLDADINTDVLICGDSEAKERAQLVVEMLPGARMVDCGPLENARILEPLTALIIGLNRRYKVHTPGAGIKITGIPGIDSLDDG